MEISWADRVRDEGVVHRVKGRGISLKPYKREVNYISHMLCRNCLIKHVIEGKIGERIDGKTRK